MLGYVGVAETAKDTNISVSHILLFFYEHMQVTHKIININLYL